MNRSSGEYNDLCYKYTSLIDKYDKLKAKYKKVAKPKKSTSKKSSSSNNTSSSSNNSSSSDSDNSSSASYTVYITDYGQKYHAAGCRYLKKSSISISKSEAEQRGYTACSHCHP